MVKYLVENGADLNSKEGLYNDTALILASKNNFSEIVKYLHVNGADVNAKNDDG
jgi:ankyrin repeat protein